MQSTVQLFNTALARLGGDQIATLSSSLEGDSLGILCENLFPQVLELSLTAHAWSFALSRALLARVLASADAALTLEACTAYQLPSDCVRPVRLEGPASVHARYVIEGKALCTYQEHAVLVYVRRVVDPRAWPSTFAEALAWGLAGELASARQNDAQKQSWCYQNHKATLAEAIARDIAMQNPLRPRSAWQNARFGRGV